MAKAKVTKRTTNRASKGSTSAKGTKSASPRKKVAKVVDEAKALAKSPAASEIIAATLVAAAAALRDPRKARALATEAADDLKQAAKKGVEGGALWQLALDVARSSIDTLAEGKGKAKAKKAAGKAKDKAKKAGKKK